MSTAKAVLLTAVLSFVASAVASGGNIDGQSGEQQNKSKQLSSEARARVRQKIAAVGLILVRNTADSPDQGPRPRGSAVVVRKDGVVVTNYHVIAQGKTDRLYDEVFLSLPRDDVAEPSSFHRYRLKALLVNKQNDLVLLRIATDSAGQPVTPSAVFQTIELADSRAVQTLDDLIFIGYPEQGGATVTVNLGQVEGKDVFENWIKTNGRLIHGNSGGAAVGTDGKLIGIATKVLVDRQPIDKDGDGFPDDYREYGSIGFLRPAHLIDAMLSQLSDFESKSKATSGAASDGKTPIQHNPQVATIVLRVTVSGVIKSNPDGKPIAGVRVGLVPLGSENVTADNLLTWGGTNADGQFEMNKPVPLGRYTLKARAIGYEMFTRDVEINQEKTRLIIEMRRSL